MNIPNDDPNSNDRQPSPYKLVLHHPSRAPNRPARYVLHRASRNVTIQFQKLPNNHVNAPHECGFCRTVIELQQQLADIRAVNKKLVEELQRIQGVIEEQ